MVRLLLIISLCLVACFARADEAPIPRQIIAFYDSHEESTVRFSLTHRFLEMPANHLGYNIQFHDISKPLPELKDDVRGIILWFYGNMRVPDVSAYLDWLLAAQKAGRKIIIMESAGISPKQLEIPGAAQKYQALMTGLGISDDMDWNPLTYDATVQYKDTSMVEFERQYPPSLPAFSSTHLLSGKGISYLKVAPGKGLEPVDLVVTSPGGGFVAPEYAIYMVSNDRATNPEKDSELVQWYINPFLLLSRALDVPAAPIPDVTTLDGRRIFYSHIDGDGWNSLTEVSQYREKQMLSSEVLYHEILVPYSDFVFNVGLITGDIDPDCYAVGQSERVAREIFALPNVEPTSHTYSHPLFWRFFSDYTPEKEAPYLDRYPPRPSSQTSIYSEMGSYFDNPIHTNHYAKRNPRTAIPLGRADESDKEALSKDFDTPRSYVCGAYNLHQEIEGSIDMVNAVSPLGKKAVLVQWSGNTSPYEEALAVTRKAGLLNINGGDSRFDREYPSYGWVAPIGLQVGKERQIYSSNSNENTYTNLWTGRFFGFSLLQTTVVNTESPIRISPFNLYFHIYSAQKNASLKALKQNLEYARSQPLIKITASQYARIAESFYTMQIIPEGSLVWRVENRGFLNTIRMDNADNLSVDINHSNGILGFKHYQGSMYISLDSSVDKPVITLINNDMTDTSPQPPYLIESSWQIKDLHGVKNLLTFVAQGYGKGEMIWQSLPDDHFRFLITRGDEILFEGAVTADKDGVLKMDFDNVNAIEPVNVTLKK